MLLVCLAESRVVPEMGRTSASPYPKDWMVRYNTGSACYRIIVCGRWKRTESTFGGQYARNIKDPDTHIHNKAEVYS